MCNRDKENGKGKKAIGNVKETLGNMIGWMDEWVRFFVNQVPFSANLCMLKRINI